MIGDFDSISQRHNHDITPIVKVSDLGVGKVFTDEQRRDQYVAQTRYMKSKQSTDEANSNFMISQRTAGKPDYYTPVS